MWRVIDIHLVIENCQKIVLFFLQQPEVLKVAFTYPLNADVGHMKYCGFLLFNE